MQRFPERAGAHWWVSQARCLEGLERLQEAEAALREGVARFPNDELPHVVLANMLSRQRRFAEALPVWRDLFAAFPTRRSTGISGCRMR